MNTFQEYEEAAVSTAIYPGQGSAVGLMYCALKLNGEAGELAEHVGKAIRDEDFILPKPDMIFCTDELRPERKALITKEIGDILWYVAALARELDTSLAELAQINIDKLAARKAAGKLGGSGDNR